MSGNVKDLQLWIVVEFVVSDETVVGADMNSVYVALMTMWVYVPILEFIIAASHGLENDSGSTLSRSRPADMACHFFVHVSFLSSMQKCHVRIC